VLMNRKQMMSSFRFDKLQGFDDLTIHIEKRPEPQRGEVLVKVHAVSLNRRDLMIVQGDYPGNTIPGLIPCSDAAGEVIAIGEDVTAYKPGDRVINTYHPRWFGGKPPITAATETYGNGRDGWLTEYKAISQEGLVPLPDSLSWEEGSTLSCAGVTAWNALHGYNPIKAGQIVLTLGSGNVSIFAIQLAKALGATVIATTSDNRKSDMLKKLGADHIVNYREIKEWGHFVREKFTKHAGVDRIVEVVGPAALNDSLTAICWGGEIVLIGQLSKSTAPFDSSMLKKSGAILRPIGVGDRTMLQELVSTITAKKIKPVIDKVFPFKDSKQAFERLQHGDHFGKIIIRID